jgi:hypothetical protein
MKHYTKEDYERVRPKRWIEEDLKPVDTTKLAEADIESCSTWWKSRIGHKMVIQIKDKIDTLVRRSGNKPEGSTNVNPMGINIIGPNPKDVRRDDLLTRRAIGEDYNEQAVIEALNATSQEIGFVKREDNDYPTQDLAMFAVECDSISSKGPFDGGNIETALSVGQDILEKACGDAEIPEDVKPVIYAAMDRMSNDFAQVVDPKFKFEPSHYVDHMLSRGLSNTMRGYPFIAAGDSLLKDYQFEATKQLFANVQKLTIHKQTHSQWLAKHMRKKAVFKTNQLGQQELTEVDWYSVDMFIEDVICELFALGLKLSDWFSPKHNIIINVSRNQGAGWKVKYKKGKFVMDERKAFKFRYVCPAGAFIQAWSIVASIDLILKAPATEGRIGLQTPELNDKRFDEFLTRTEQRNKFIVSTDFSSYDTTLPTWMMNMQALSWAVLYEDEYVRDALSMAGILCGTKFMIMPTWANMSRNYGMKNAKYWNAIFIKGDARYIANNTSAGIKNKKLKKDIEALGDKFDYQVRIVYMYQKYLISGIIYTNTIGSCCTLTMGRTFVPYLLHKMRKGEIQWKKKK